jgi:hypothetical protein
VNDTIPGAVRGAASSGSNYSDFYFGGLPGAGGLLRSAEERFGAERFQRFWSSSAPADEAFEAAFGVRMGTFMRDNARSYGWTMRRPPMSLASVSFTMALIIALIVLSARNAQRRTA